MVFVRLGIVGSIFALAPSCGTGGPSPEQEAEAAVRQRLANPANLEFGRFKSTKEAVCGIATLRDHPTSDDDRYVEFIYDRERKDVEFAPDETPFLEQNVTGNCVATGDCQGMRELTAVYDQQAQFIRRQTAECY